MSIKTEKKIRMPKRGDDKRVYPFDTLEVEESFFVPLPKGKALDSLQAQIMSASRAYADRHDSTLKFSSRQEDGGIRIWRTA